jgi:hypothetical protein
MTADSRRQFLATCVAAVAALLTGPERLWALGSRLRISGPHPTPRPGITGAKVLGRRQLGATPKLIPLFDAVREIPEVVDGIRCNCGCADSQGLYSLLSCYEGESAMARTCRICQGQGRLAVRLHKEGKTLDEVRVAIDAEFG